MSESQQKPLTAGCHSPRSISDQSGGRAKKSWGRRPLAVIGRCGLYRTARHRRAFPSCAVRRCARGSSLLDIEAVALALNCGLIEPEQALELLVDCDRLQFVQPTEPEL